MTAQAVKYFEFFLNYSCNARCGFCFNPPDATPQQEHGLPLGVVAERMYGAYGQGYRGLKFIGGEVTLREDLPKIMRLARRIGYGPIQVTTNAIRLADPAYAAKLISAGANIFRFSLHGHTPELHDRIVKVPGAWAKALQAQANLRRLGLEIGINYVINRLNCEALPDTLDFFLNEMRVSDVLIYFVRHQGFMALKENEKLLGVKMSKAAGFVRASYQRLEKQGHAKLPYIFHMPPCMAPEYSAWFMDWSVEDESYRQVNAADNLVIHPDGIVDRIESVTHKGKTQVPACSRCVHQPLCLGVERSYLDRYGSGEIEPVMVAVEARG